MSLINATSLGPPIAMLGMAVISGWALAGSVRAGEVRPSLVWAVLFVASTLVAAWLFGKLLGEAAA